MNEQTVREIAGRVLRAEAEALHQVAAHLDGRWARAVDLLFSCRGKVAVLAVGKSGHVGRKLAATLSSLGTPAFFLHAGEAAHGDLGMLARGDVVLAISNSGETPEVVTHLDTIRRLGYPLIALTRSAASTLGRAADVCLELPVAREADHLNLAPTVSTTVALAAGDALAVALAERRGLTRQQFAERHPGGVLGQIASR